MAPTGMIEPNARAVRTATTTAMTKPLISHGAPDEVFVMGDLGFEIDVAALISRINLAPREKLDIREGSTADLMDIGRNNGFNPSHTVSKERMEEPVLLLTLTAQGQRHSRVVDGTHRLHARHRAGHLKTSFVAIAPAMIRDLVPRALPSPTAIAGYLDNLLGVLQTDSVRGRELLSRFVSPIIMTPETENPVRRYRATGAFNLSFLLTAAASGESGSGKSSCAGRI